MSGQISDDEYRLIRDYCILPFVRDAVANNMKKMQEEKYAMKTLYIKSSQMVLDIIDKDIREVRQHVRKLEMQIVEIKRNDDGILYEVILRGYKSEYALVRHVVRNEMAERLQRYIGGMFN
ncbi:hypothetical protein [Paenibacillus gorillae]|uniref:hypothetical protein n=1 Tax=Paenibacillus gorillae TaxID=1243662 RepID=UPI0005A98E9E|nr:hypothetical protein [Paenibacillus gorillae]